MSKLQIVIPMSGFGERFRRAGYVMPKPLIDVQGRPIVSYVADMFPADADFLFICNEDHLATPAYDMRGTLESIRPQGQILGIPAHRKGPVYAVSLGFDQIRDEDPVIVNYCDFTCYWDCDHFLRFVAETGCDGAIPAYRGFHPHSIGSTFYAYMRETDGWVDDIQEKTPFTDNPLSEYASSGTYYFHTGALMKQAFRDTMTRDLHVGNEYYVSLAYKPLLQARHSIAVYALQHFMQWGTPEDLADYLQYDRAFRALAAPRENRARHSGALLLPIAGAGQRFVDEGFSLPKALVPVGGRAMAVASAGSLPQADRQVFVLRADLAHVQDIVGALKENFPNGEVVMMERLSEGQAITCLEGLSAVAPDMPLTIGVCDTGLIYNPATFQTVMDDTDADVVVWGFRGHAMARRRPQAYGWIQAKNGEITNISVKTPLSDTATDPVVTGVFTFRRAADFRACVDRLVAAGKRINNEYYVDSCINEAIALGLKVRLFEADAYLCWGTPDELRSFEYWQSCFHKWDFHPYRLSKDSFVSPDLVDPLERRFAAVRPTMPKPKAVRP